MSSARWGGRGDYVRIVPENVFELIRAVRSRVL
jgi:hypothetical protein